MAQAGSRRGLTAQGGGGDPSSGMATRAKAWARRTAASPQPRVATAEADWIEIRIFMKIDFGRLRQEGIQSRNILYIQKINKNKKRALHYAYMTPTRILPANHTIRIPLVAGMLSSDPDPLKQ